MYGALPIAKERGMIEPYLFFDGRCEEALAFYREALGAEISMLMRFSDSPNPDDIPPGQGDKIMHAHLHIAGGSVMASDGMGDEAKGFSGFALSLPAVDPEAARRYFDALAEGGEVQMPLQATFWSPAFGLLRDRFGVPWMVSAPAES